MSCAEATRTLKHLSMGFRGEFDSAPQQELLKTIMIRDPK